MLDRWRALSAADRLFVVVTVVWALVVIGLLIGLRIN